VPPGACGIGHRIGIMCGAVTVTKRTNDSRQLRILVDIDEFTTEQDGPRSWGVLMRCSVVGGNHLIWSRMMAEKDRVSGTEDEAQRLLQSLRANGPGPSSRQRVGIHAGQVTDRKKQLAAQVAGSCVDWRLACLPCYGRAETLRAYRATLG
jgi:hypothetical protein